MSVRANKARDKLKKLKKVLADARTMLIVMQDNPDPDAIGAATALKKLAKETADVSSQLSYGGTVGRAENRELIYYLQFKFYAFGEVDWSKFDLIAMVDTQPRTGNNPLPANIHPDIVIDHHPIKKHTYKVEFTDIRQDYGATSTILWEYLSAAKVKPDIPLATAMLYGIMSDTRDLGMEATKSDIEAMEELYPLANKRMLGQIKSGRLPNSYFEMLESALNSTMIYEHCAICGFGRIDNPDMIGEVADLILRHERVDWVLCYGVVDKTMRISLRTQDRKTQADKVVHAIVRRLGTGGGHSSMAGGQIELNRGSKRFTKKAVEKVIRERFLKELKIKVTRGVRLVPK